LALLDALPILEEQLVESMQMCEFSFSDTPEEIVRMSMLANIRKECSHAIAKVNPDPSVKDFTDFHDITLADFIADEVHLFAAEVRAVKVLGPMLIYKRLRTPHL
jgi:hypothetical protein